jgi:hypothetical protein
MWIRRNSLKGRSKLEAALRMRRAEPSAEFVDDLARRLVPERPSPRRAWSQLAFAAAVSVFILGTFASFGGLSYAASGATDTYKAVKQVVVTHKLTVSVHTSSAAAQYPHKPKKPKSVFKPPKPTPPSAVAGVAAVPSSGTLPFTGFSLLATFLLSLALIGAGVALRRREGRN